MDPTTAIPAKRGQSAAELSPPKHGGDDRFLDRVPPRMRKKWKRGGRGEGWGMSGSAPPDAQEAMSIMFPPIDPMSGTPPALTREQDEGMEMEVELELETGPNHEMEVARNKGKQKAMELVEGDYEDDGNEGWDHPKYQLENIKGKKMPDAEDIRRIRAMIERGDLAAAAKETFSPDMLRWMKGGFINTVPSMSEMPKGWPGTDMDAGLRPEHLYPTFWQVHPSSIRDSYGHLLNPQSYTD